ncbi:MAG: rRNA maturation RNase YbeY [Cyanobacteria bacterium P01_C01_bin.72]
MSIAVGQSINSDIYVEHDYQGDLPTENLAEVAAIDWACWLQNWLTFLSKITKLPQDCELSLKLTSDRGIQEYNSLYRHRDGPTDVLAFAAMESSIKLPKNLNEPFYLGDIIISLDTAVRQAQEQKHSLKLELAWLGSHGLLHLLGWDHPDDESLRQMLDRQAELISIIKYI